MIDVRRNFKGKNETCRLQCKKIESQEHIFLCQKLNKNVENDIIEKINSANIRKNREATYLLRKNLKRRDMLYRKIKNRKLNMNKIKVRLN